MGKGGWGRLLVELRVDNEDEGGMGNCDGFV